MYSRAFFEDRDDALRSARAVVPIVHQWISPRRVVDVGCGVGSWLKAFSEHGVTEITGVDGDYVARDLLLIPEDRFIAADLSQPLEMGESFDLVISLEVAEHLPETAAGTFVRSLTSLGPVILFSAAIPLQGGVNHLNEQWPDYWTRLFAEQGFHAADCLRSKIWRNDAVNYFYAQNAIFYLRGDAFGAFPRLAEECRRTNLDQLSIVHPKQYLPLAAKMHRISQLAPAPLRRLARRVLALSCFGTVVLSLLHP